MNMVQKILVILFTVVVGILALLIVKWVFSFFIDHWIISIFLLLCALVGGFLWLANSDSRNN
jgi:hypothetical protein